MGSGYTRSDSKVEITGLEARHYDKLLNIVTGGTYPVFIRKAVRDMDIQPGDAVLDLASGTGRNPALLLRHLSSEGRVVGLEIGDEMLEQARRLSQLDPRFQVENQRIEEPLAYREEFDKVLVSFALHGFVQEDRLRIIDNAFRALRAGGRFFILDYDEFEPTESLWPVRWAFAHLECPLATDFVRRDWRAILADRGFDSFGIHRYYFGYVRLLSARRPVAPDPGGAAELVT